MLNPADRAIAVSTPSSAYSLNLELLLQRDLLPRAPVTTAAHSLGLDIVPCYIWEWSCHCFEPFSQVTDNSFDPKQSHCCSVSHPGPQVTDFTWHY